MSELVKELRFLADSRQQMGYDRTGSALDQSADRIEKLEAALREISGVATHGYSEQTIAIQSIARTALSP